MSIRRVPVAVALLLAVAAGPAGARGPGLGDEERRVLDESWQLVLTTEKGPYTQNFCVCRNGERQPVMLPDGRIVTPCGGAPKFCAAFREPWGQALADQGLYIGNLFARDLFLWDEFPDHHDLVRGFVLEKFFIETHPDHVLAKMRAYGGLAGAEFEARDAPLFFERYLDLPEFDEPRHYLLAYELQRRFFVRDDQGRIGRARDLASAIQSRRRDFKPLRDQVHNQISAAQIPRIRAFRDTLAPGPVRDQVDELIIEMGKLTSLNEAALKVQIPALGDAALRARIANQLPAASADPIASIAALADLMGTARRTVTAKEGSAADRRRLVDLAITAAAVAQQRGMTLVEASQPLTARKTVELLIALVDAAYGGGLLMERERAEAVADLQGLLDAPSLTRDELNRRLARAARVVEWAQLTALYAFEEVRLPWVHLLPEAFHIPDDILRSSPLLVYGRALEQLENFASGAEPMRHEVFGETFERGVRALNPGVALGTLRVAPSSGEYSRNEVVALPETPADLEPAAGILTRGEGNVVSHVQLLARSLGIPNAVLGPAPYALFEPHDGARIFYISTPGGRVVVKSEQRMEPRDRAVIAEYTRNQKRTEAGDLAGGAAKLDIDVARLDLKSIDVIDLARLRRTDSGVRVGPKAAFLGELKHHFPNRVARGVVVPFGAYQAHFRSAPVAVPPELAAEGIAEPGTPLKAFVKRTYATFFGKMVPAGTDERALSAWIGPRLHVMRHSIEQHPLSERLRAGIREQLAGQGLLDPEDPSQTVGLFVRSDTNVEDLENFNGAGLNLTLFNQQSLDDIYAGLVEVWASPFTYRSFSWRQTLIDEPMWVLPSVVILESIPTTKSGVLVTAGPEGVDATKMLIATSEGVGGAVDGTPAETLVWSPDGVELVTMFKSPYRRLLVKGGGSEIVPSTGSETVLTEAEIAVLVETASLIRDRFAASLDPQGRARPWDVEFGFADGELWLFQARPFIGNDSLANIPALAAYDPPRTDGGQLVSLDQPVR